MKLFIGWSGDRSRSLAEALHSWIPLVLHYVEPWLSEADIKAGERWGDAVAKELEVPNFGVICVTRDNISSPWILFEAGALAKLLQGSRVIPLLLDLDIRDIAGPLAQFQAKKVERTGVWEVVQSINQLEAHPIQEDRIHQLFDALWPEFEKKIGSIPQAAAPAKHTRPQTEILEELVASVRSLDSRYREVMEEAPRHLRSRKWRLHPMMVREMCHMMGEKPGTPISILIAASPFREEIPWLYELGMEAYRAAMIGDPDEAVAAIRRFRRAAELLEHGPFAEELGIDPRVLHMLFRELERFVEREPEVSEPSEPAAVKAKRPPVPLKKNPKPE